MKKILKNMIFATAFLSVAACSLKEEPTSFVNKHNFYQTAEQCKSALNACYTPLNAIYVSDFMIAVEACSDLWSSGSSAGDSSVDVSPSKPQVGARVWENGYKGIVYCNEAIACIERAPIADSVKGYLAAEGRVLRAMYYYLLTSMFDGVPYYTCMVDNYHVQDSIRVLPRTPADTIRARLYDDLRDNAIPYFTEESGLKVRGGDAKDNRSGYAHGLMLMAKMAMWNACSQDKDAPKDAAYSREWFEKALVPLNALEELYGDFTEARYPLKETQWRYKNTAESIFEIQHAYSREGIRYHGNVAAIMMPKYDRDKDLFDGAHLTGYGTTLPNWNSLKANNAYAMFRPEWGKKQAESTSGYSGKSVFDPLPLTYDMTGTYKDGAGKERWLTKIDLEAWEKKEIRGKKIDRRVEYAVGLGNFETGETFGETKTWGVGWAGPKFWCPDMENTYDSNNYRIFRYADAILMKAEALANLEDQECVRYLNMVRARAGVNDYEFVGFPEFLTFLYDERARELGGEFMRKFDLVRWGIWHEAIAKSQKDEVRAALKCHRYYPIPDKQCALSNHALSNPEYEANGLK